MIAKFAGKCRKCGERFEAGVEINFDRGLEKGFKAAHQACHEEEVASYLEGGTSKKGRCLQCGGTGRYITGSVNGKLVGPGSPCYRCDGKGNQTKQDAARNRYFDLHRKVPAC